jgi:hypothetical protein
VTHERLFETAPDDAEAGQDEQDTNYQRLGVAAELMAISKLMFAGHHVAQPVTDDDGVDLIVDYRTLVQVKSTGHQNNGVFQVGLESSRVRERRAAPQGLKPHVDVLLVYARDIESWWVIPSTAVPRARTICLGRDYDQWREAWELFE